MKKNIFDRVQALCQNNGIAISELEKRLNLSNGAIGKWRKSSPTAEKVAAVASYFDVSTDYLLGLTDVEKNVFKDNMLLSLEKAMPRMTDDDKDRMMRILKAGFDEAFQDDDASAK
jgi:transcriptional regulator with XRE-family HTH domain